MWFIIFLLLLCPHSFAADCRTSDFTSGGTYNCTNLIIDAPLILTGAGGTNLEINVTGNTEIRADIILNGASGINVSADTPGGAAAPGGWNGGGLSLGTTQDGGEFVNVSVSNGTAGGDDITCGNGGGGAGFTNAGKNGELCPTTADPLSRGVGGSVVPAIEFDFAGAFRGGFGGGAGAFSTPVELGTGGGGGGALHINSTGDVTIISGVTLSAKGGNGGNALITGGGGGAGSGGAIWIQSTGRISNLGILDVRGGTGGKNNSTGAHGGDGGDGAFRLQDSQGVVTGTGVRNFSSGAGSEKLRSDISCATLLAKKEDSNFALQLSGAFLLTLLSGLLVKTLYRFPQRNS
ncbi:MAG TPA: hypothetical protein VNJ01_06525 [Bacteriovoracaceae bacterium]|nr:hypothetical protein [Bacteriovoracaceae bacterium]